MIHIVFIKTYLECFLNLCYFFHNYEFLHGPVELEKDYSKSTFWLELLVSHLLGRCSTTWPTLPVLFCVEYLPDRVFWTICPGWLQTMILLISDSWAARIISVSHQHLVVRAILKVLSDNRNFRNTPNVDMVFNRSAHTKMHSSFYDWRLHIKDLTSGTLRNVTRYSFFP
jgi:hypothetical protein